MPGQRDVQHVCTWWRILRIFRIRFWFFCTHRVTLRSWGFADNELEAVAAILADPVDTVVVDLNLREGSGMGVIEKLRRANMMSQPMIIVFSNQFQPEIKMRALALGADYFFDKSTEFENVKATIRTLRAQ